MSEHDQPSGPDALTPFEFALAGVTPPGAGSVSSLRVIEDMRALVDGQHDVPVVRADLGELLDASGWFSLGADGRQLRPRGPVARKMTGTKARGNGAFVDITPPDMVGAADAVAASEPAVAGAARGLTADRAVDQAADDEPDREESVHPANPDPVDPDPADSEVADSEVDGQRSIDAVQAELQLVLAQSEQIEVDLPTSLDDELATGPIAADPSAETALAEGDAEPAGAGDPASPNDDERTDDHELADPSAPLEPAASATTTDRLRDHIGRFGPVPDNAVRAGSALAGPTEGAATAGQPLGGQPSEAEKSLAIGALLAQAAADQASPDDDPMPAMAAGAAGLGIFDTPATDGPPLATVPSTPAAAVSGRRSGSALVALAGAGAAAAVLVAGSLWWASTTSTSSTEADQQATEAAAPVTETDDLAAGSLGGPAQRSTGDDTEPAEFTGEDGSDTAPTTTGSGATLRATIGDRTTSSARTQSTTTTPGGASTTAESGATSAPTIGVSTSRPAETSTTTTTRSTTTRPETTTSAPTTTASPSTTQAPVQTVFIGDRVTVGGYNGPGLGGVVVSVHADDDRDGRVERLVAATSTTSDGRYSFDLPPGCYEVRFAAPAGYQVRADHSRQYLCLDPGEVAARTDAIVDVVLPDPPSGCLVERAGSGSGLGVEVYERSQNWAQSYTFYSASGSVVARTRNLGPYDTDDGDPTDREWFGAENNFDHRAVRSVAAERNGVESSRLTCQRD